MSASILDRPVRLSEMFEPELFTELCRSYADLYRVGVKVFDEAHHKLVDVAHAPGLMSYAFQFPEAKRRLTAFVSELKAMDLEPGEWRARDDDVTGTRWLVTPLVYGGDVLGKLVAGPYLAADGPAEHTPAGDWFAEVDADRYERLRRELRRLNDATLRKVVESLTRVIDIVCHAGYRAILTSNMHLESIGTAYDELQQKHRELEEKNRQLEETNERLRELDKLKSNFLATVSHELRTPLTSVIGYSEMLLEGLAGELKEEQRDYVGTIMEKGESLLHLISGILDISKIEKGTAQPIVRQRVRPETLVDSALSTIRPQAQKKELNLTVSYSRGLPEIQVDTYKIRQVLINLLGNAVKFTPNGGTIGVDVDQPPGEERPEAATVRFRVRDDGIGIPEDKLERVFDVFFQVDNTSTREYGGTGLGLSIVRNFVESHGGDVSVTSEMGKGSTFSFTVPVEGAGRSDASGTESPPEET